MSGALDLEVALRWADIDVYGHVNNVALLGLIEQARLEFFARAGAPGRRLPQLTDQDADAALVYLTGQVVEYHSSIAPSLRPLHVRMWVTTVSAVEFELGYEVRQADSTAADEIRAVGLNSLVFVNPHTRQPQRITATQRSILRDHLADAPRLRRRWGQAGASR